MLSIVLTASAKSFVIVFSEEIDCFSRLAKVWVISLKEASDPVKATSDNRLTITQSKRVL